MHFDDPAGLGRLQFVLHLHRLDDEQRIAGRDLCARFGQYAHDLAGHRRHNGRAPARVRARGLRVANPQQKDFTWGRRVLFDYKNKDGVRLQGILALPDDYKAGEKRPMLVTFYEKNSQNMHRYNAPSYLTGMGSSPMEAVSRGYIAMLPDVYFHRALVRRRRADAALVHAPARLQQEHARLRLARFQFVAPAVHLRQHARALALHVERVACTLDLRCQLHALTNPI